MRNFRVAIDENDTCIEFTLKSIRIPDILKETKATGYVRYYVFERIEFDKTVKLKSSYKNCIYVFVPAEVEDITKMEDITKSTHR